ncbi:hypothetical protein F442_22196, partial [Phytophthora nicotianae P10297]
MSKKSTTLAKIRALLEDEENDDSALPTEEQARGVKIEFYQRFRGVLSVNEGTIGLEILDDVAEAVIDGDEDPARSLSGSIHILPLPSRQCEARRPPPYPVFAPEGGESTVEETKPAKKSHKSKKEKSKKEKSKKEKAKKEKSKSKKEKSPRERSPSLSSAMQCSRPAPKRYFRFDLTVGTPQDVADDLEALFKEAALKDVSVHELSYPWTDSEVWYDQDAFFHIHVEHWRWWMKFRPAFFDWQLNIPYRSQQLLNSRRKLKMQAHIARIKFLSMCIETWGYFGFLSHFEACTSNRRLMWMGGQPGRNTGDAKSYYGPVIENLRELLRRDPDAYTGKMKSALQPFRLDEGGFTNVTSLLVNLGALDPNNPKKEHRLSDRALARVIHDIISRRKGQSWWFGVGWPWDSLRN